MSNTRKSLIKALDNALNESKLLQSMASNKNTSREKAKELRTKQDKVYKKYLFLKKLGEKM